jgi:hypothetical protein
MVKNYLYLVKLIDFLMKRLIIVEGITEIITENFVSVIMVEIIPVVKGGTNVENLTTHVKKVPKTRFTSVRIRIWTVQINTNVKMRKVGVSIWKPAGCHVKVIMVMIVADITIVTHPWLGNNVKELTLVIIVNFHLYHKYFFLK